MCFSSIILYDHYSIIVTVFFVRNGTVMVNAQKAMYCHAWDMSKNQGITIHVQNYGFYIILNLNVKE